MLKVIKEKKSAGRFSKRGEKVDVKSDDLNKSQREHLERMKKAES